MKQTTFRSGDQNIRLDQHEASVGKHPAIILLHGAGGNVGWWLDRLAPHLTAAGLALYAPHYFDRTQTPRADLRMLTDGVHVPQWIDTVDATLTYVAARPTVDPARIVVMGISLGSFLALALAAQLSAAPDDAIRRRIRALVDISGGLVEPYATQATGHFPPTLILHGNSDEVVSVTHAQQLDRHLTTLQVRHVTRILENEGHFFSGPAQMQLLLAVGAFLKEMLSQ